MNFNSLGIKYFAIILVIGLFVFFYALHRPLKQSKATITNEDARLYLNKNIAYPPFNCPMLGDKPLHMIIRDGAFKLKMDGFHLLQGVELDV